MHVLGVKKGQSRPKSGDRVKIAMWLQGRVTMLFFGLVLGYTNHKLALARVLAPNSGFEKMAQEVICRPTTIL